MSAQYRTGQAQPRLSIVVVNYNVKDFLYNCLRSIQAVDFKEGLEVIVVDNNSSDGSIDYLQPLFPDVCFQTLAQNIGFGRANNVGIEKARGEYILLLNPDTIVSTDTFRHMCAYMESHPDVGIAGCKVLNGDGSFQLACRRGFPTPWASFCKLFGLQRLFPRSPLFARYNQTFRPIDETYAVDSVIGAFMFCRADVLRKLGGFDPDYFMYGEDIDLCYRCRLLGYRVMYVHGTTIIHYKGESTKRSTLNEVKVFYDAMEIFVSKHFRSSLWLLRILRVGIKIRSLIGLLARYKREVFVVVLDLIALVVSVLVATLIRHGSVIGLPDYAYPIVFVVTTLVFAGSMFVFGDHFELRPSFRKALNGVAATFIGLAALTYFFKDFAFSRTVLVLSSVISTTVTLGARLIWKAYERFYGSEAVWRIAVLGPGWNQEAVTSLFARLSLRNVVLVGQIGMPGQTSPTQGGLPHLGGWESMRSIVQEHKINEVLITRGSEVHQLPLHEIVSVIDDRIRLNVINSVEDIGTAIALDELGRSPDRASIFQILSLKNRIAKRCFDIAFSIFLCTIGLPCLYLLYRNTGLTVNAVLAALAGRCSYVGPSLNAIDKGTVLRRGLFTLEGLVGREVSSDTQEYLNDYYMRSQTVSFDIEIIAKHYIRKARATNLPS